MKLQRGSRQGAWSCARTVKCLVHVNDLESEESFPINVILRWQGRKSRVKMPPGKRLLPWPSSLVSVSPSEVYCCAAWGNSTTSCLLMVDGKIRSLRQNQCIASFAEKVLVWKIKASAEQGRGLVIWWFTFWYFICRLALGQRSHFEENVIKKSDPMSREKGFSCDALGRGQLSLVENIACHISFLESDILYQYIQGPEKPWSK